MYWLLDNVLSWALAVEKVIKMIQNLVFSVIKEGKKCLKFDPFLLVQFETIVVDDTVEIMYDFGMSDFIYLEAYNVVYCGSLQETVRKVIETDLFYAFFCNPSDPKYTTKHWALFGNLQQEISMGIEYYE